MGSRSQPHTAPPCPDPGPARPSHSLRAQLRVCRSTPTTGSPHVALSVCCTCLSTSQHARLKYNQTLFKLISFARFLYSVLLVSFLTYTFLSAGSYNPSILSYMITILFPTEFRDIKIGDFMDNRLTK